MVLRDSNTPTQQANDRRTTPQTARPLGRAECLDTTVDPRVTTGLTYEQLGLRPKLILVLTYDQILSYDPHAGQGNLTSFISDCFYNRICGPTKRYMYVCSYAPHGVRKLQSEPRYACLWT
jgi:hypothetical protein